MEVSAEKQFKENRSRNFLYLGLILFFSFLVIVFGFLNFVKAATSPSIITYQGKLLNGGSAVTTTQAIKYVLYDAASSGNALYSAAGSTTTPSSVSTTVSDGFFTIDLGDTGTNAIDPAIFKNNQAVYLEVTVGSETLSPRKRITASPFALNSKYLDGVGASSTPQSSAYIPVSDSSGNFNLNSVTSTGLIVNGNTTLATATITSLVSASSTFTNATTTGSFWSNVLTAVSGWFSNLFWTDATSTGHTNLNTLTTTGNTTLATTTISSSTIGYLNVSNNESIGGLLSVTGNSSFAGVNTFSATSTFAGNVGIGTTTPRAKLHVYDGGLLVDNPINVTLAGSVVSSTALNSPDQIEISGKYGYVVGGSGGTYPFAVLDLSTPSSPVVIGFATSSNLSSPTSLKVAGHYAYIGSDTSSSLNVIDVSNPHTPSFVGYLSGVNITGLAVVGKYVYAIAATNNMYVIDVSNPANPTVVSTKNFGWTQGKDLYIKGKYAYVAYDSGIEIIDISNPHSLSAVGFGTGTNFVQSIDISGQYAYVLSSSGGVQADIFSIYNISNPDQTPIAVTGSVTDSNIVAFRYLKGIKVAGNYAYLSGGGYFVVVDISNKSNPRIIKDYSDSSLTSSSDLDIAGKYAYALAGGGNGVWVFDLEGADISSANIGAVGTDRLSVWNDMSVGNNVYIRNSLNVGEGGLLSNGPLAVTVSTTISTDTIFSVGTNSSSSILAVRGDGSVFMVSTTGLLVGASGNVGIGTSTPSEKLHVNGGNILQTAYGNPTLKSTLALTNPVAVYISNNYAYVADNPTGLRIIDISNPSLPSLVSTFSTTDALGVYVSGNYAYVAAGTAGLKIIDISSSATPTLMGTVATTNAFKVYVSGKYAYVADYASGLKVIDVSNPTAPVVVSTVSGTGITVGVYISGKYAYMADNSGSGLKILDISNPSAPRQVGVLGSVSGVESIYVSGKYAYLASGSSGLQIVNISNPANPILVSTFSGVASARGVNISGNYAYVTDYNAGLRVIDISSSTAPVSIGILSGATGIWKVAVVGKYAYMVSTGSGFQIVDINGISAPSISVGNISTNDLTVSENLDIGNNLSIRNGLNIGTGGLLSNGMVAITVSTTISTSTLLSVGTSTPSILSVMGDGKIGIGTSTPQAKLHLFDGTLLVDNPRTPTLLGSITSSSLEGIYANYVSGNYAYAAASTGSLSVIDISNKNSPAVVGSYSSTSITSAFSIAGMNNYVYVPSTANNSISIFDVSNPKAITLVGSVTDSTRLNNIASLYAAGRYVFASCYTGGGLTIVDVSNPTSPSIVSFTSSTANLVRVQGSYVVGRYAYVADATSIGVYGALSILDISNPRSPTLAGYVSSTLLAAANKVYVSGRYAYVTGNGGNVLSIIDVSNPASPSIAGGVADSAYGTASGLVVAGNYAYVGTYSYMLVIDISVKTAPVLVGRYTNTSITAGAQGYSFVGKYAYVSGNTNNYFAIMDLQGANISSADIGNVSTNKLTVWENSDIGNSLFVRNSLNVGDGGIVSNGPISIFASSTASSLFSIATSTNSKIFNISAFGNIEINTSSFGSGNSFAYKILIDAGGVGNGAIGTNGFIRATAYITPSTTLDLAETYPVNMLCSVNGTCPTDGDVVCTDPTVVAGVKKCSATESDHIVGIVSTNPGFLLGGGDLTNPTQNSGTVKVALAGRVPVKVSSVNGAISAGDKLTLSNSDGVAAKAVGEVPIVAIAMENYSGSGDGEIVAFVNLGWQNQLYQALTVDTSSSTLTVGSDITPYNLALSGEFTMFNNVLNKLVFNATALFESRTNGDHAFIFNAINFATTTNQYLLSLRSNNDPRFSVMANGDVHASGNLYAASAIFGTSTNPGDLAERVDVASDDIVEPGDVLVVDMNNPDTYRRSNGASQQAVAGVVSTNPTIVVGNGKTEYTTVLAMVGRVPLKVSDENGPINRGDLLVTASSTGYAMKYDPKKDDNDKMVGVVGVALDPFSSGKGKITALVRAGWVNSRYETLTNIKENIQQLATAQGIVFGTTSTASLSIENNSNGQLSYSGGNLNLQGNMLLNVASVAGKNNRWSIDQFGHFITRINTSQGEKEMYAIQSPSSEFVFSSSSQLMAGEVKVVFDQIVQDVIDPNQPLKINITLTSGEAKGIYVSEKSLQGFTVKELNDGKSNATFDWMVVAKRKEETTNLNITENLLNNIVSEVSPSNSVLGSSAGTSSTESSVINSSTVILEQTSTLNIPVAPIVAAPAPTPIVAPSPVSAPTPAPAPAPVLTAQPSQTAAP